MAFLILFPVPLLMQTRYTNILSRAGVQVRGLEIPPRRYLSAEKDAEQEVTTSPSSLASFRRRQSSLLNVLIKAMRQRQHRTT